MSETMTPYYEQDGIAIYHGDCRDILPTFPDKSFDLVLTDPPYKVSQKYGGGVDADNLMGVSSILLVMPELSRVLDNERLAFVFYDNRILPFLFQSVRGTRLTYRKQIFLYRRWGNANRWLGWMQCTDPCCIFVNGYDKPFSPKINGRRVKHDTYTKASPEEFNSDHPAQKPEEITSDIVEWGTEPGEIVLDPFMGSGTTLVAAKQLGRKAVGIEIEEKYCEIAVKRLAQMELFQHDLKGTP